MVEHSKLVIHACAAPKIFGLQSRSTAKAIIDYDAGGIKNYELSSLVVHAGDGLAPSARWLI